jgi:hypothetical protein
MEDPVANILAKTHQGAPGNLGLGLSLARIDAYRDWSSSLQQMLQQKWQALLR